MMANSCIIEPNRKVHTRPYFGISTFLEIRGEATKESAKIANITELYRRLKFRF